MAAANKPVAGAPVESAWGGQVHDVAVLSKCVIVSGALSAAAYTGKLAIDNVMAGNPAMADLAADELIIPQDGIYEVLATCAGSGAAAGATYLVNTYLNGAYCQIGGSTATAGGSSRRMTLAGIVVATAGWRLRFDAAVNPSGGQMNIERASLRLIAQALG